MLRQWQRVAMRSHEVMLPHRFNHYATLTADRKQVRHIATLRRQLIKPTDYIDLSRTKYPKLHAGTSTDRVWYSKSSGFPQGAHGFLYYRPSDYPLDPGEIRLRVTEDNNPSSFEGGRDLLRPEGFPWCTKVPTLASQSIYAGLRGLLLQDGLVSETDMQRCASIGPVHVRPSQIYTLEQPFHLDLSLATKRINIITGDKKFFLNLHYLFFDRRTAFGEIAPYTGHIMARFEILKGSQQNGPMLVIRILELLTPVKCVIPSYDNYIQMPVVGALHSSASSGPYTIALSRESKKNTLLRTLLPSSLQLKDDAVVHQ